VEDQAKQAAKKAADASASVLTVPVYFQPWKYEHEKHLLVPLVLHVVEATREALRQAPSVKDQLVALSQEADGKVAQIAEAVHKGAKTARKWFPVLKKIAGSLSIFGVSIALPDEIDDWLKDAEAVFASPETKEKQRSATARELRQKKLSFVDNGFHYYELHELLSSLTRPRQGEHTQDLACGTQAEHLRINFVIFIDDLDRCLPEKAVETLELIKTVFNLESFAFVLALDEEVVERGIGHRYAAYTLAGKKPEMPITGFEYLEKIVHLPFRLPALSRGQAADMLRTYESTVLAPEQPHLWWFAVESKSAVASQAKPLSLSENGHRKPGAESLADVHLDRGERTAAMELLPLVLESFDAYVPRKLIRIVELLHQVAAVMRKRQRPLTWKSGAAGSPDAVDVRVVLALLMLQLFQPELYRLMRRRINAFPALLSAFAKTQVNSRHALGNAALADMDLYHWCACESSLPHASETDGPGEPSGADPIARIQRIAEPATRALAQQVRLPMVELLVQYRAAQRHPFDALKLMQALARSMDETNSGPQAVTTQSYWELLAADGSVSTPEGLFGYSNATQGITDGRAIARSVNVQKLFEELTSTQTAIQANLAQSNGLELGMVLPPEAAKQLIGLCNSATYEQKQRIAEGLPYLAPYLARSDGLSFAVFVKPAPGDLLARTTPFDSKEQVAEAAAAADLRVALGLDQRFNPQRRYLPFRPSGQSENAEPIAGFVRVPKGRFTLGAEGKGFEDNPLNAKASIHSDFYIARYLTTVDQYAHFVAEQGYGDPVGENPGWWDTLGWAWRTGQWDSKVKDKALREHLARRVPELRGSPYEWAEQLAYGSRPVMRLNWFEARAYANWLTLQLKGELDRLLPGYAVRLPTETQWERAARAKDLNSAGDWQYPWGSADPATAKLNANIGESGIRRPSPVGLFAPNPLGLHDICGNLWEWQNNLYWPDGSGQEKGLITDVIDLKTDDEPKNCDLPALRGGAWYDPAVLARASFRSWVRPDSAYDLVGFRVVLSLANLTSET
jgi:formylglycine-generating enzyme required for sulfatase activity